MVGSAVGHNTFAALILSLDAAAIVLVLLTYKNELSITERTMRKTSDSELNAVAQSRRPRRVEVTALNRILLWRGQPVLFLQYWFYRRTIISHVKLHLAFLQGAHRRRSRSRPPRPRRTPGGAGG